MMLANTHCCRLEYRTVLLLTALHWCIAGEGGYRPSPAHHGEGYGTRPSSQDAGAPSRR